MKSKDLIELLKKIDPSGETVVSFGSDVIIDLALLPGYYDGAYSYINEEGKYVKSRNGKKIVFYTKDYDDILDEEMGSFPNYKPFDKIKERFLFDNINDDDIISFYDKLLNSYNEKIASDNLFFENSKNQAIIKAENGWKFFQNKLCDNDNRYKYYKWQIFDENNKVHLSNVSLTEPILYSGLWDRVDNNKIEGFYEWVYKKL